MCTLRASSVSVCFSFLSQIMQATQLQINSTSTIICANFFQLVAAVWQNRNWNKCQRSIESDFAKLRRLNEWSQVFLHILMKSESIIKTVAYTYLNLSFISHKKKRKKKQQTDLLFHSLWMWNICTSHGK